MNNILDKTKKTCYGCGACVTVCPVNAITYQLNEKGFYEPNIIQEKCVECGKCKQVCLKYKAEDKIQHPIREGSMLAARSKDPDTVLKLAELLMK